MRRGITSALSRSCKRQEGKRVSIAALLTIGLVISQQCISAEIIRDQTDQTLLTTNVVWLGLTNVSPFSSSSNVVWRTFPNGPGFQPGRRIVPGPRLFPGTNSIQRPQFHIQGPSTFEQNQLNGGQTLIDNRNLKEIDRLLIGPNPGK